MARTWATRRACPARTRTCGVTPNKGFDLKLSIKELNDLQAHQRESGDTVQVAPTANRNRGRRTASVTGSSTWALQHARSDQDGQEWRRQGRLSRWSERCRSGRVLLQAAERQGPGARGDSARRPLSFCRLRLKGFMPDAAFRRQSAIRAPQSGAGIGEIYYGSVARADGMAHDWAVRELAQSGSGVWNLSPCSAQDSSRAGSRPLFSTKEPALFRTRLAVLVLAGSLSFTSGCTGVGNHSVAISNRPCCNGGSTPCCNSGPMPCCGEQS